MISIRTLLAAIAVVTVVAAGNAGAETTPETIRKLYGLPPTVPVTTALMNAHLRTRYENEGRVFFDEGGAVDRRSLDAHVLGERSKLNALPAPKRRVRATRGATEIIKAAGTVREGRVTKRDYRGPARAYALLDPTGRGYFTEGDVAAVQKLGPSRGMRLRAARLIKRFDKNGDGKLSPSEIRATKRAQKQFARYDANGDKLVTFEELAEGLAKRREMRRAKTRNRM